MLSCRTDLLMEEARKLGENRVTAIRFFNVVTRNKQDFEIFKDICSPNIARRMAKSTSSDNGAFRKPDDIMLETYENKHSGDSADGRSDDVQTLMRSLSKRARRGGGEGEPFSVGTQFEELLKSDAFQEEIVEKSQRFFIGRQEAEDEVIVDRIVELAGSNDEALLFVITTDFKEPKIQVYVNTLLSRGANPRSANDDMETPLFLAVKQNYRGVCSKLLENEGVPHVTDKQGRSPLKIAIEHFNDNMASLLIDYMPNHVVRKWFVGHDEKDAEFSLHELLLHNMEKTVLAVLDCMVEPQPNSNMVRVYYDILESDSAGRPPDHENFDVKCKTCFQMIAKSENKTVAFHTAVRLLIRLKWKTFANRRYQLNLFQFIFTLFTLTFSAVTAAEADDPMKYEGTLQLFRGIFEVWTLLVVLFTFILEINQFRKHKIDYWKDKFNWLEVSASCLLITVLPLRIAEDNAQWYVYSVGYLLWTLRIFKYSTVFRNLGAYSLVLWKIMEQDITQFTVLFFVFLLTFSGAIVLSLRGENSLHLHSETKNFWSTMFTGLRTLIEAQPVVEDYVEYKTLSVIWMVLFLFISCVVLLNLLIAQLSDTYQNVQQDAQRGLELNRAWIITRFELHGVFLGKDRHSRYVASEDIPDLFLTLEKWDTPPLNELSATIRDIDTRLDAQKLSILTIQHRQIKVEANLHNIKDQMTELLDISKQLLEATSTQL